MGRALWTEITEIKRRLRRLKEDYGDKKGITGMNIEARGERLKDIASSLLPLARYG